MSWRHYTYTSGDVWIYEEHEAMAPIRNYVGKCVAFLNNGSGQCGKPALYQDGELTFCGIHHPYFRAKKRALRDIRRVQVTDSQADGEKE